MDLANINSIIYGIRPEFLEAIFKKSGLELEGEWRDYTWRKRQPLMDALSKVAQEDWEMTGREIERLARLGGNKLNIALMRSALREWGVEPPEDVHLLTAINLAAWCYLHLGEGHWLRLEHRVDVNAAPRGDWHYYTLEEDDVEPNAVRQKKEEIEKAIAKSVIDSEYRGHGSDSDAYGIDGVEYVVVRLTDYPQRAFLWKKESGGFAPTDDPMAFQVVFSYERECGRLGILYEGSSERCDQLSGIFAATVFGKYAKAKPIRYEIKKLRYKSQLASASDLNIKSARIVGMELWLDNNRNRKRLYYECDQDIQKVLESELSNVRLSKDADRTAVKRVYIRIAYETVRNAMREKTFSVSEGSIGGASDQHHGLGRAFKSYLKDVLKIATVRDECD